MADDFLDEPTLDELGETGEEQELFEHFRFIVDKGQAIVRVDKYLVNCMSNTSRNRIQEAADAGNILVNGKSVKSNYKAKPHDIITIVLAYPPNQFEIICLLYTS